MAFVLNSLLFFQIINSLFVCASVCSRCIWCCVPDQQKPVNAAPFRATQTVGLTRLKRGLQSTADCSKRAENNSSIVFGNQAGRVNIRGWS